MKKIDDIMASPKLMWLPHWLLKVHTKLPHLPKKVTKFFVWLAPWLSLLSGIVGILAGPIMALLGLFSLVTLDLMIILSYVSSALIMIISTILAWKAFKAFRKQQPRAWYYLFWSQVLWLIDGIIEAINGETNVWGLIIGNLIGFYILLEMSMVMGEKKNSVSETH